MKFFKQFYDEKYSKLSLYIIKTTLMIFVMGLIIFTFYSKTRNILNFFVAILGPLILGMALAYLLEPLVEFFENRVFYSINNEKKARVISVAVTFTMILIFVVLILLALIMTVTRSIDKIEVKDLTEFINMITNDFSKFWASVEAELAKFNINLGNIGTILSNVFNNVSSGASTLLFANIFAVYFLLDSHIAEYWQNVLDVFTSEETRKKLADFSKDADRVFSGYIRGQSIDAFLVGVMVTIALVILRVPYAVVIGLITGIGNLIPYVGPILGFASLAVVAISEGSMFHLAAGGAVLGLVMAIDGNIINPKLLSDNVEIHPVLVIVALIAGGEIGGVLGMLLAVPCAALLKLQFDRFIERRRAENEIEQKAEKKKAKKTTDKTKKQAS
ncbi:MAG: AI-2E family transporter [Erysipelotrichaceae bacterium]|nr:AI-2E family transporter [Erysipelotrichaceae bacterium]